MKQLFLVILLCVLYLTSFSQAQQWFGSYNHTYKNKSGDYDTIPYRMLIPESDESNKLPLIIWLHGKGERGRDNKKQLTNGVEIIADSVFNGRYRAIIVAPQCPQDKTWSIYDKTSLVMRQSSEPTEIEIQLMELINNLINEYPVDKHRLYIVGISMGGFGVWDIITRWPDKFAAAVPICGGGDPSKAKILKNLSVWAFHGENDNVIKPSFTKDIMQELIKVQQNKTSKMTIYPNVGHGAWIPAFKENEILSWLFSKRKTD